MMDTPPAVRDVYRQLLMQRSGAERLRMGADMFDAARALVRASLGDPSGVDSSADMKIKLFLRIYGPDFDRGSRERIMARLRARDITRSPS
jgi:hypothetical protein